jgi:DNA-binding response OmpR family regulator
MAQEDIMYDLLVMTFNTPEAANGARTTIQQLQRVGVVTLEDAAVLRHQAIKAERQHQLTALTALLQRQRTQDALMQSTADGLCYTDLVLYPRIHQVFRDQDEIQLTAKEFELLELFLRHPHQVLTRVQIYEHIWRYDFGGDGNHIEVYVCYLRTKLEATGKPRLIQTVRGVGYVLRTA